MRLVPRWEHDNGLAMERLSLIKEPVADGNGNSVACCNRPMKKCDFTRMSGRTHRAQAGHKSGTPAIYAKCNPSQRCWLGSFFQALDQRLHLHEIPTGTESGCLLRRSGRMSRRGLPSSGLARTEMIAEVGHGAGPCTATLLPPQIIVVERDPKIGKGAQEQAVDAFEAPGPTSTESGSGNP